MRATHVETLQKHLEELKNALEGGNNFNIVSRSVTETTRTFVKRIWLSSIPRVLCLHLNRLVGHGVKLSHHVMFQMELEVSEFFLFGQRNKESATYTLRSVVVHHGTSRCVCVCLSVCALSNNPDSLFFSHVFICNNSDPSSLQRSGHYTVFRYLDGNKWVHISDTHVQPVSVHEVLACEAYLLFYQR